jgi:hypothetical protein
MGTSQQYLLAASRLGPTSAQSNYFSSHMAQPHTPVHIASSSTSCPGPASDDIGCYCMVHGLEHTSEIELEIDSLLLAGLLLALA